MVSNLPPSIPPHFSSNNKPTDRKRDESPLKELVSDALSLQPGTTELRSLKDKMGPVNSSTLPKKINPVAATGPSENWEEALEQRLLQDTVDIPESNSFAKTNVVVFKNDYRGVLPLNGMMESEWIKVSGWINELKNTGKLGSLELRGDAAFKEQVINSLVKLCERSLGRELIGKVIQLQHPCYIHQNNDFPSPALMVPDHPEVEITAVMGEKGSGKIKNWNAIDPNQWNLNVVINPLLTTFIYVRAGENRIVKPIDLHLVLAHELIHAVHASIDSKAFFARFEESVSTNDDNREEHMTITGWKSITAPQANHESTSNALSDEEDWTQLMVENESQWDRLSENGLHSVTDYFRRDGHDGMVRLKNPDLSLITSKLAVDLFMACVNRGDVAGMEELLAHNWMSHVRAHDPESVLKFAAQNAALNGQSQSLEKLFSLHVNPALTNQNGQNFLHQAAAGGHPALVNQLINTHHLDPLKIDAVGQTPLWLATIHFLSLTGDKKEAKKADFEQVFTVLLKQGASETSILGLNSALGALIAHGEVRLAKLFMDQGAQLASSEEKFGLFIHRLGLTSTPISDKTKEFINESHLLEGISFDSQKIAIIVATALSNDKLIDVEAAKKFGLDLDLSKLDAPSRETILAALINGDKGDAVDQMRSLKLDLAAPLSTGQSPLEYAQTIGSTKVVNRLTRP